MGDARGAGARRRHRDVRPPRRSPARAASRAGIPYTLSTVSVCSIEEVASHASGALWSQLYVLKDRGYMRNALERARRWHENPVFTVDMPIPGSRYRDNRSGMSGPHATLRQYLRACTHPRWAMNVGLAGRPCRLVISKPTPATK